MAPTRTQRWLDLLSFLLGRHVPVPVEEIMDRIPGYAQKWREGNETDRASVRRTFERDKDDLRRLGVPLEPVAYAVAGGMEQYEGYRIAHRDFYLPYLRVLAEEDAGPEGATGRPYPALPSLDLSSMEAEAALEALRRVAEIPAFPFAAEAASALRKLAFDLDPERFPGAPVVWVEPPGSQEVLARLRVLSPALLARKHVEFRYHGIHRGQATDRRVAPYGLYFQRDWYLVAHDEEAASIRIFRVSRMDGVAVNTKAPKTPDFELPDDFSLGDFLGRRAWELGDEGEDRMVAEVRFRYPLSLRAERNGEGEWVRDEADGSAVRRFTITRPDPFVRWILSLAGGAEILSPPELRGALLETAQRVAELYPDAGDAKDG